MIHSSCDEKMKYSEKEFFIEKIEYYKKMQSRENFIISLSIVSLSIISTFIIVNNLSFRDVRGLELIRIMANFILFTTLARELKALTKNITNKIGIKLEVKEIEDLFAANGLVLEDEISKSRGM